MIEIIATSIGAISAILAATWKLSSQLASLNETVKGMREDLQEAVPMIHDHEKRLSVVEIKVSQ